MGKKSPEVAEAPDPKEVINAQAEANRINQKNPFFNVKWNGATQNYSYSPELEGIFNQMVGLAGDNGVNSNYVDMQFNRASRLLDRQYDQIEDRARQRLADQGFAENSEGWEKYYRDQVTDPRERAYNNAAFSAVQAGDAKRAQDYNIMSSLLGRPPTIGASPLDVTGPYNAQLQQNNLAAGAANQANQDAYANAAQLAAVLASAYFTGGTSLAAL